MNNIELLDYFAGHVLQAMLTSDSDKEIIMNSVDKQYYYPRMAYFMANLMLEERKNYFPSTVEITTAKQLQ